MQERNPNEASRSALRTQAKDKKCTIQLAQVFEGFFHEPLTMLMLSRKINLERASICWYARDLRKENRIAAVKRAKCAITNHWAFYWTTDPEKFPQSPQLKLFT